MSEATLPKGQTVRSGRTNGEEASTTTPKTVSIQDILNGYPVDREKCRDVLMMEASRNIGRIADSLEAISQSLIVVNTHLSQMNKK
jgi:hypothetical protein